MKILKEATIKYNEYILDPNLPKVYDEVQANMILSCLNAAAKKVKYSYGSKLEVNGKDSYRIGQSVSIYFSDGKLKVRNAVVSALRAQLLTANVQNKSTYIVVFTKMLTAIKEYSDGFTDYLRKGGSPD